jgi:phage tail-like protein
MSSDPKQPGEMMKYLPSIFHEDIFLAEYLSAFEKILLGAGDPQRTGLEAIIADIAVLFNPKDAPEKFLPWLAGWMAFGLRADLPVNLQRSFLSQVISLYKKRGTPESMKELLKLFTRAEPTILEGDEMADEKHRAWNDWHVNKGFKKWEKDGKPDNAFGVLLSFMGPQEGGDRAALEVKRTLSIASALIDLEKPAHTIYYLVPITPSLRLPKFSSEGRDKGESDPKARSRIGFETMLGVRSASQPESEPAPKRTSKPATRRSAKKSAAPRGAKKGSAKKRGAKKKGGLDGSRKKR